MMLRTPNAPPGYLYIRSNNNLHTLTGFGNLASIGGYLYIRSNPSLTITGFGNLLSIQGILSIGYNDNLQTITGFGNLASIGDHLNIDNNGNLDFEPLRGLSCHGGVYSNDPSSYCQGCPQWLIGLPRCYSRHRRCCQEQCCMLFFSCPRPQRTPISRFSRFSSRQNPRIFLCPHPHSGHGRREIVE